MVDNLPAPRSPSPAGGPVVLGTELRRDKPIYMAAFKVAKTIGEETIKALPGGPVLLGLLAGFESLAEDADDAELSERVDRLLDIGQRTEKDVGALTALAALMVSQQALLLERMQESGQAPAPRQLDEAARAAALIDYRKRIARDYYYADYRGVAGITREEHAASLPFDQIYVRPRLLPERETGPLRDRERDLLRLLEDEDLAPEDKRRAEEEYAALTGHRWAGHRKDSDEEPGLSVGEALADHRHAVILGGPGVGKSVLTRYLARTCALGPDVAREELGWPDCPTPVLLPLAAFADSRAAAIKEGKAPPSLRACLDHHLTKLGGEALRQAMAAELDGGSALVLLDGVDEVPDQTARIAVVKAVDSFLDDHAAARCVVTSRPYGYIRLKGDLAHFQLANFSPKQVETFVHNWQCCFERWRHPLTPNVAAAEAEAEAMVAEIRRHPRVAELATNPLMLVIIALIRVEDKRLPEKRVELYSRAVNTLIDTWNRWRSQTEVDVGGAQLPREKMIEVWRAVALWTRRERPRSLVHRTELQRKLVELLEAKDLDEDDPEATAESYLNAAAARAGLLEERGQNVFAFWHPTFEEFLAAMELATPSSKAAEHLLPLRDDPRWREVILLAAGYVGVVQNDRDTATEITRALAEREPSPSEPVFHGHLFLAADCIADDVGVQRAYSEEVIVKLAGVLGGQPYAPFQESFVRTVRATRRLKPKPATIAALEPLTRQRDWEVRMEAVRLLANAAAEDESARALCERMLADSDSDVRAHAALGVVRAGDYRPEAIAALPGLFGNLAHAEDALRSFLARAPRDFTAALLGALAADDPGLRLEAARLLVEMGRADQAVLDALLRSLAAGDPGLRVGAARLLHQMGRADQAVVDALLGWLAADDPRLRAEAGRLLREMGRVVIEPLARVAMAEPSREALAACNKVFKRRPLDREDGEALAQLVMVPEDDLPVQQGAREVLFDLLWQEAHQTSPAGQVPPAG